MADERLRAELAAAGAQLDGSVENRLETAILALATHRAPRTTCPSDAARAIADDDWRHLMDRTREIARTLARRGAVVITQRGERLDPDKAWKGPVRIGLPDA